MVSIKEAIALLEAGFTVEDIRAMDAPPADPEQKEEQKEDQKKEQKEDQKKEQKTDPRIDALTSTVEKLVDVVGKMPFFASMGDYGKENDTDAVLASIINPPKKEDK